MDEEVICWDCKEEWPLTDEFFYRDSRNKSGFRKQCKACFMDEKRKRQQEAACQ